MAKKKVETVKPKDKITIGMSESRRAALDIIARRTGVNAGSTARSGVYEKINEYVAKGVITAEEAGEE